MSGAILPSEYLIEIQGFRPMQAWTLMGEVAALQLVFLPLVAEILDIEWVDCRWVNGVGLLCLIAACVGSSQLDSTWSREQFYFWQAVSGLGQACLVLSLLLMATNAIAPHEGPLGSSLVNMPRGLSEVLGLCLLQLMSRFRGQLHATRILESAGAHRFSVIQANGLDAQHLPPLLPDGATRSADSLHAFAQAIDIQSAAMVFSDDYLVLAAIAAVVFIVLLVLPQRTWPPRIALLKK
jgi:DHA2 family multidrug resistance protein